MSQYLITNQKILKDQDKFDFNSNFKRMIYETGLHLTPQIKPIPSTQSVSHKPSVYDFPDIKNSKFFKLQDFNRMNQKFNQELTRTSMYRNLNHEESYTMQEQLQDQPTHSPSNSDLRMSSFDMSRLENRKKKTGFMFDCFNVFKKQAKSQQSEIYQSRIVDESTYFHNVIQKPKVQNNLISGQENKKSSFFDLSNSAFHKRNTTQNLKSSRSIEKQSNNKSLQKGADKRNSILSEQQVHQTYEIKLDFKLKMRKPQFCMGAFSHTQSNIFGSGVNLNISLPSLEQHKPFESMVKPSQNSFFGFRSNKSMSFEKSMDVDESIFKRIKQSQSRFFQGSGDNQAQEKEKPKLHKQQQNYNKIEQQRDAYALALICTAEQKHKSEQEQNHSRALEFGLIEMDVEEISFIAHKFQDPEDEAENILTKSIFQNYEVLLEQPEYLNLPIWESKVTQYDPQKKLSLPGQSQSMLINSFEISYEWHEEHMSRLEAQFSVRDDALFMIDDSRLFVLVAEMLQGVENQLFMLDYERYEWYIDMRGLRFEHNLRSSFVPFMQEVLILANMRSRLEKAVEYMSLRPFRRVYFEVAKEVKNVFKVLEEYLLEFISQKPELCHTINLLYEKNSCDQEKPGFLEFFVNVEELVPEIRLLYQLLICEQEIQRENWSYFTFDHRFLHSQFYVFERVLKMSREVDQTNPGTSHIAKRLLRAAFRPIISSLNRILFEQTTSISPKEQIYLKYYYESTRQIFNQVSKKMQIVHTESPELYVICKEKLEISIEVGVEVLRNYEQQWARLFLYKYTQLQTVLDNMMRREHERRHVAQKQKEIELQLLKKKLKDKTEKEIELKMVEQSKRDQELADLRKQIQQKEERKKLQDLIEKQAERGYLLEDELKKKISLLKEKEKLINQLEGKDINQPNEGQGEMIEIGQQIHSMQDQTQSNKQKKWKQSDQIDEQPIQQNNIQQKPQKLQSPNKSELPVISQQTISLPIVNQQLPDHRLNQKEKYLNDQNNDEPKSPKSARSRKIRKNIGKIKSRGKKQTLPGKIYFNPEPILPNSSSPQNPNHLQSLNFAKLCEKSKKLNFTLEEQPSLTHLSCIKPEPSDSSFDSQSFISSDDEHHMEQQIYENHAKHHLPCSKQQFIPTNCIFQICIDSVLGHQIAVVNNCFEILVFQKYHFRDIIKFMKNVFLSQNGDNHRTLLSLSVNPRTSIMSLKYFNDCFLFDNLPEFLQELKPSFYNTRQESIQQIQQRLLHFSTGAAQYYGECNLIHEDLEQYVGFQFANLPVILEPYLSYIHLSKYVQIFAFILRIKHSEMMIGESWLLLNEYKKELFKKQKEHKQLYGGYFEDKFQFETKLLNELFVTRHIIQCFLTTYQNYIFFRVIQKEFKSLNQRIQRNELSELQSGHLKLLDTIIRFAFVDNSVGNITKEIRKLLQYIREFRNIVDLICSDDVLEEQKNQVRTKVKFIHTSFKQNHKFFQALYYKN